MGLSPHTRGKPIAFAQNQRDEGPIPAYAGETFAMHPHAVLHRAYPRIRGGNDARHPAGRVVEGLSPHTRGKRKNNPRARGFWGPIPAYAGETARTGRVRSPVGAYPRIRGGNVVSRLVVTPNSGLSPHTRGKPAWGETRAASAGPIPAYAGETR